MIVAHFFWEVIVSDLAQEKSELVHLWTYGDYNITILQYFNGVIGAGVGKMMILKFKV